MSNQDQIAEIEDVPLLIVSIAIFLPIVVIMANAFYQGWNSKGIVSLTYQALSCPFMIMKDKAVFTIVYILGVMTTIYGISELVQASESGELDNNNTRGPRIIVQGTISCIVALCVVFMLMTLGAESFNCSVGNDKDSSVDFGFLGFGKKRRRRRRS